MSVSVKRNILLVCFVFLLASCGDGKRFRILDHKLTYDEGDTKLYTGRKFVPRGAIYILDPDTRKVLVVGSTKSLTDTVIVVDEVYSETENFVTTRWLKFNTVVKKGVLSNVEKTKASKEYKAIGVVELLNTREVGDSSELQKYHEEEVKRAIRKVVIFIAIVMVLLVGGIILVVRRVNKQRRAMAGSYTSRVASVMTGDDKPAEAQDVTTHHNIRLFQVLLTIFSVLMIGNLFFKWSDEVYKYLGDVPELIVPLIPVAFVISALVAGYIILLGLKPFREKPLNLIRSKVFFVTILSVLIVCVLYNVMEFGGAGLWMGIPGTHTSSLGLLFLIFIIVFVMISVKKRV
jgi:hypothetical protein